jgi:hypothetical protein
MFTKIMRIVDFDCIIPFPTEDFWQTLHTVDILEIDIPSPTIYASLCI